MKSIIIFCMYLLFLFSCSNDKAGGFGSETTSGKVAIHWEPAQSETLTVTLFDTAYSPVLSQSDMVPQTVYLHSSQLSSFKDVVSGEYTIWGETKSGTVSAKSNLSVEAGKTTSDTITMQPQGIVAVKFPSATRCDGLSLFLKGSAIVQPMIDSIEAGVNAYVYIPLPAGSYKGLHLYDQYFPASMPLVVSNFAIASAETTTVDLAIDSITPLESNVEVFWKPAQSDTIDVTLFSASHNPISPQENSVPQTVALHSSQLSVFEDVDSGGYTIWGEAKSGAVSGRRSLSVEKYKTTSDTVDLQQPGVVAVKFPSVTRCDGLSLLLSGSAIIKPLVDSVEVASDAYVYIDLPVGAYKGLQLYDQFYPASMPVVVLEFSITSGETTAVDLTVDSITSLPATGYISATSKGGAGKEVITTLLHKKYNPVSKQPTPIRDTSLFQETVTFQWVQHGDYNLWMMTTDSSLVSVSDQDIFNNNAQSVTDTLLSPESVILHYPAVLLGGTIYLEGSEIQCKGIDGVKGSDETYTQEIATVSLPDDVQFGYYVENVGFQEMSAKYSDKRDTVYLSF